MPCPANCYEIGRRPATPHIRGVPVVADVVVVGVDLIAEQDRRVRPVGHRQVPHPHGIAVERVEPEFLVDLWVLGLRVAARAEHESMPVCARRTPGADDARREARVGERPFDDAVDEHLVLRRRIGSESRDLDECIVMVENLESFCPTTTYLDLRRGVGLYPEQRRRLVDVPQDGAEHQGHTLSVGRSVGHGGPLVWTVTQTGAAMTDTIDADARVAAILGELSALEDPRIRAVNERHGDDHGVNLTKLRAVAKPLKTDQDLALALWATGDTAARLVALLVCRPKEFDAAALDAMIREAGRPKVHDWLVNYVIKKNPHAEELRVTWMDDPDPDVRSAGWALTTERVTKNPDGLDLTALLDTVESEMKDVPGRLQWTMNACLATIGIEHPELRDRAVGIGERLRVLEDYPTSPGCISPYAPVWIREMVARKG